MNTVQRIAMNTGVLLASRVASYILGFFVMYIARYLGAEGFGISSFALAFTRIWRPKDPLLKQHLKALFKNIYFLMFSSSYLSYLLNSLSSQ